MQWVWPIIAYVFILYSEIRTNLSNGHPLIPRRPDKRGLTVHFILLHDWEGNTGGIFSSRLAVLARGPIRLQDFDQLTTSHIINCGRPVT